MSGTLAIHCAKVVVCFVDGKPIEAVVPAPSVVVLDRLRELTGGTDVRVAQDEELHGPWFEHQVYVDVSLAVEPNIVFGPDAHVGAVSMRWADFSRTVKPIVGRFAGPPMDRVPAYRLSHRE